MILENRWPNEPRYEFSGRTGVRAENAYNALMVVGKVRRVACGDAPEYRAVGVAITSLCCGDCSFPPPG